MTRLFSGCVLTLAVAWPAAVHAEHFVDSGPLRIRDQFAPNMGLLAFEPDTAGVLQKGLGRIELVATVANSFATSPEVARYLDRRPSRQALTADELAALPGNNFLIDAEVYRVALTLDHGVSRRLQVGVSLQWLSFSGGVFDGVIEGIHDALNLGQSGRTGAPRNGFTSFISSGDLLVFDESSPTAARGDIVLRAKLRLVGDGHTSLASLQGLVKLPLRSGADYFSSGNVDKGLELLMSHRPAERLRLHTGLGVLRLGRWDRFGMPTQTLWSGMAAGEFDLDAASSLILQMTASESPFATLDLPELGQVSLQLSFGYRHAFDSRMALFIALTENIIHFDNSADVGLHLGLNHRF